MTILFMITDIPRMAVITGSFTINYLNIMNLFKSSQSAAAERKRQWPDVSVTRKGHDLTRQCEHKKYLHANGDVALERGQRTEAHYRADQRITSARRLVTLPW